MIKEIQPRSEDQNPVGHKIFLAGTIEMGNSIDWQRMVVNHIAENGFGGHEDITIFNPRRDEWPNDRNELVFQINWEQDRLYEADQIIMFLAPGTTSPISLLELGEFSNSGKISVICPEEFYRYDNVMVMCERCGIPLNQMDEFGEWFAKNIK